MGRIAAYQHLHDARALLRPILYGKDGLLILGRVHDWIAQEIEASLRAAFTEADSSIALDVLASYLAGAHVALVQRWLQKRHLSTPKELAQTLHRLQRAAIRDAFGLQDGA